MMDHQHFRCVCVFLCVCRADATDLLLFQWTWSIHNRSKPSNWAGMVELLKVSRAKKWRSVVWWRADQVSGMEGFQQGIDEGPETKAGIGSCDYYDYFHSSNYILHAIGRYKEIQWQKCILLKETTWPLIWLLTEAGNYGESPETEPVWESRRS